MTDKWRDFNLDEVVVGETVMYGRDLHGDPCMGIVSRILPGRGFCIDTGIQEFTLVRELQITDDVGSIRYQKAMLAANTGKARRTDSTMKPGQGRADRPCSAHEPLYGVVDHAWWEAQGVEEPDFAVFATGTSVADMAVVLERERQPWGDCAAEHAWQRQMAALRDGELSPRSPLAPHRSPPLLPLEAPPAPTRPAPTPPAFERPSPLNLEGLLSAADDRLHAPRAAATTVTPTYSVASESESESESEPAIDTMPLRNAPPLEEEEEEEEPDNYIHLDVKLSFPWWLPLALVGILISYLWMVAALVSSRRS